MKATFSLPFLLAAAVTASTIPKDRTFHESSEVSLVEVGTIRVRASRSTVAQLLDWDQQTMMPPRGAASRAETVATVQRISHEMFVSDEDRETADGVFMKE